MRYVLVLAAILFCQVGFSQLTLKPVSGKDNLRERAIQASADINKNTLPFWDDFSISNRVPDPLRIWDGDTTRQWHSDSSKHVFVNATLAKNPPTYKVVTFDGLTGSGTFHGDDKGLTDQLMSDTIDLSGYNEADDIYFSFYWQAGGNVEIPEPGDSIRLQFYDPNAVPKWTTLWKMDGEDVTNDSIFYQEARKLTQRFLTDQFMFRFQSFGDQDGPFDAWHLDWIYMDNGRSVTTINNGYDDAAFSGEISSPITPFYSIPTNQFLTSNDYVKNQQVSISYLNQLPPNGAVNTYGVDITYIVTLQNNSEVILNDQRASNQLSSINNNATLTLGQTDPLSGEVLLKDQNFSSLLQFDSAVIETTVFLLDSVPFLLDGQFIDLRVNDTIRTQYLLHDYYAFDDGSAEYAVGTNIRGGRVGVQYWVNTPDTLTHIDIHFPNIDPSSTDKSITLVIYRDLDDEIPLRTQAINITTATEIDAFTRYVLDRPVVVSDTFFITYEQNVNEYIGIGFDRSNPAASKYIWDYNQEWVRNERLQGALMIRPVFQPVPEYTLAIDEIEPMKVYPNPTSSTIKIDGPYQSIQIHNLSGQLILDQLRSASHDLSSLQAGLYLLTIQTKDGKQTQKIIKE